MVIGSEIGRAGPVLNAEVPGVLRTAEVRASTTSPVRALAEDLGPGEFSLVALFVTSHTDFAAVVAEAETLFPDTDVVACTTAGELGAGGY